MRPVLPALVLLLALPLSASLHAQNKTSTARDLHALFDAEWERGLRENPVGATYIGDHRFDDRWPDLSPAAMQASYEGDKSVIAALDKVDPKQLTPEDQLNRDLFRRQYQANIDAYDYGSQYTPISQDSGLASMHRMADVVVFRTVKDCEPWLSRSPFYDVFKAMPDSIPAKEQARLQAAARDAITKTVVPSYTKLRDYIVGEYLPRSRESVGLRDTRGGTERYAELARFYKLKIKQLRGEARCNSGTGSTSVRSTTWYWAAAPFRSTCSKPTCAAGSLTLSPPPPRPQPNDGRLHKRLSVATL